LIESVQHQEAKVTKMNLGISLRALGFLAVLFAVWLPRGLALDRFVTPDEPKWLARSANFYRALSQGDLKGTFTREHPGVTVTWIGTAGLLWRYPEYPKDAPGRLTESAQIETVLREQGKQPLQVLEGGRILMVFAILAVLLAAFWQAARLAGWLPAIAGFLLIAFDPFHAGLTRLLHLDGLASSLMLLSILAFFGYLYRGRRLVDLLLSGTAAGFGWLTKSPAFFLAPFLALITLVELGRLWLDHRSLALSDLWRAAWPVALWSASGWLVFILFWPSMWVQPVETLERVFTEANTYAAEGHSTEVFFNGMAITGDPGLRFYPVTYLWRSTPLVLGGLVLAGLVLILGRQAGIDREQRRLIGVLALYAILFTLFMTLGSKKFDRYLLPAFPALDLAAGIGWVSGLSWLGVQLASRASARFILPLGMGIIVAGQALGVVQTYPYYLSYYNPLMGGSGRAPEVMMIGWGEGIDQAARYLNAKPGAADMQVMSWYPDGVFSYIFNGRTIGVESEWELTEPVMLDSDYVVTYIHQWQRHLPFPEMLKLLSRGTPEKVIYLDGIEYVRIYNMHEGFGP
jgi:hypothetical protein